MAGSTGLQYPLVRHGMAAEPLLNGGPDCCVFQRRPTDNTSGGLGTAFAVVNREERLSGSSGSCSVFMAPAAVPMVISVVWQEFGG